MHSRTAAFFPLLAVLLLALALRVWGLTWGLPSGTHYFSYHPDENIVLEAAMGMNVFSGHLLPGFYHYGSLQLYLVNFANSLAFVFGFADIVIKDLTRDHAQWARLYLIGRGLSVAMGVGTVWVTYVLGWRLWGHAVGLWAAVILAIVPLHAQHSHWLTVDVPATFWGTLALLWTAKLHDALSSDARGRLIWRCALWAGVFAGLASATKYNMALALLPLLTVCVLARQIKLLLLGLAAAAIAFFFACPGAVLETRTFVSDVRFEWVHVSRQPGPTFADTGNGFAYLVAHTLPAGLGLPLLLLVLASLGYAAVRRSRGDGLLAAFALPYFVVISLASVRYARYAVPLLPLFALWSGRLLADWTLPRPRPVFFWRAFVVAAVLGLTLADCITVVRPMAQIDPRDRALAWLRQAPAPASIGFAALPWFQTLPLSPYFSLPQPNAWRRFVPPGDPTLLNAEGRQWSMTVPTTDWDTAILTNSPPHYIVLSEYDYRDALRLHDRHALAFLSILRQGYAPAAVFSGPPTVFRLHRTLGGLPTQDLPHDMLYPDPTILIYTQRK